MTVYLADLGQKGSLKIENSLNTMLFSKTLIIKDSIRNSGCTSSIL